MQLAQVPPPGQGLRQDRPPCDREGRKGSRFGSPQGSRRRWPEPRGRSPTSEGRARREEPSTMALLRSTVKMRRLPRQVGQTSLLPLPTSAVTC